MNLQICSASTNLATNDSSLVPSKEQSNGCSNRLTPLWAALETPVSVRSLKIQEYCKQITIIYIYIDSE